jgi:predicted TIM-barrel fold metal-dependent hydrolase
MADVKRLVAHDLSLDLLGGVEMLSSVAELAKALPELRIVIDHLAGLRIDGQAPPADWRQAMKSVSAHANVYCKVSGLVEGAGRQDNLSPGTVDFYRPVLDTIWELFGEDWLVYGSNWPVSERFAALEVVQGIVGDYFRDKGPQALAKVFGQNAQAVYRWIPRHGQEPRTSLEARMTGQAWRRFP